MALSSQSKIKLVIADVDGTLVLADKTLTRATIDAVALLRSRGVRFAVTSGRPPRGMTMLIEPLRLDTLIAGFNGGCFAKADLSVVEQHPLDADLAMTTIETIEKVGLEAWVFAGEDWLKRDAPSSHQPREERTLQFGPRVVTDFKQAPTPIFKVVGVSDDYELVKMGETAVRAALGSRVSASRSQPYYLDVTHPDANKGVVVGAMSRLLGVPVDAIAVIGDGLNDVQMFEKGGLSIAMGNGEEQVRAAAQFVTASNADEGFAKAVADIILPRS